ncbi:MAG TPA: hypothetical protein VHP83_09445 [Aggregatilineaceae bacterium]|nr:hypothetical protein [Aggregatilineaceae bacterium]
MSTTFTLDIDWDGTWSDETPYLRRMQSRQGFAAPADSVAEPGHCVLTLDNRTRRFSPANVASPLYGQLLPRRPVRIRAQSGAQTWTLFHGLIERFDPDSGGLGLRQCTITCVDGLTLLARQRLGTPYASTYAVTAALTDIVATAYTPPAASYGDNGDLLQHYGQPWTPERTTCLDALRQISDAVWGRFFIQRDGTATFWTRAQRQNPSITAALTLNASALSDLKFSLDINRVTNLVQVKIYPVETVGAETELWRATTTLRLAPMQQRVIHALFHDSDGERCGAVDVVAPVPTTDYLVNDAPNGSGYNYTTDPAFSIATETEATRLKITLTNNAIGPLYVTLLRVRGQPVRAYDPITIERSDSTSQAVYEKRARLYDLPMQSDLNFGELLADFLLGRSKNPALAAESLTVQNRDTLSGVNFFSLNLLDKIVITDPQTGASALAHWLRAIDYDLSTQGYTVTLHLERCDEKTYWLLGQSTYSELNTTTRLGL